MPTEKQIDTVLERERAARDEEARGVVRERLVEQERLARLAEEQAKVAAARAAFLERARVAHKQACTEYKDAVDAFRAARIRLHALDSILGRGGFGAHQLGVELRHTIAAPDEGDLHDGYRAVEDSIRKTLGG
jgi:hypothetical protein